MTKVRANEDEPYPFYEIGASDAGIDGLQKPELLFVGNSLTSMESKDITSTST